MKNLILAIESSCDDSSIAVIDKDTLECKFHKKISQEMGHNVYGGVVPELAARLHNEALPRILEQCKGHFDRLCATAVTSGPEPSVSLLSDISIAETLALSLNLPLMAINHLKGHIYNLFLEEPTCLDTGVLFVSSGRTKVFYLKEDGKIEILTRTNDDGSGESFDKVAKMMNLGYPGGVLIENLAQKVKSESIHLNIPLKHSKELAYSFSGLKNVVHLEILKHEDLSDDIKAEIAYGFENVAREHIMDKLEKIFNLYKFKTFGVMGGVNANLNLHSRLQNLREKYQSKLKLTPLKYCFGNALMITRAGVDTYKRKEFVELEEKILSPKNKNFLRM